MGEKILIIGSAGSGQTSLLKHLSAAGYECLKGNSYSDAYDVDKVVCCYKLTPESIAFLQENFGKVTDKSRCVAVLNTVTDAAFHTLEGPLGNIPQVKVSCSSGEGLQDLLSVLKGEVPHSKKQLEQRPLPKEEKQTCVTSSYYEQRSSNGHTSPADAKTFDYQRQQHQAQLGYNEPNQKTQDKKPGKAGPLTELMYNIQNEEDQVVEDNKPQWHTVRIESLPDLVVEGLHQAIKEKFYVVSAKRIRTYDGYLYSVTCEFSKRNTQYSTDVEVEVPDGATSLQQLKNKGCKGQ